MFLITSSPDFTKEFCVNSPRILRKFTLNSACKREQSYACINFVERKQDRSIAAILRKFSRVRHFRPVLTSSLRCSYVIYDSFR